MIVATLRLKEGILSCTAPRHRDVEKYTTPSLLVGIDTAADGQQNVDKRQRMAFSPLSKTVRHKQQPGDGLIIRIGWKKDQLFPRRLPRERH